MMRCRWSSLAVLFSLLLVGCGSGREGEKGIALFRRGKKLVLKKDYEGARKAFEACVSHQPDYAPAHLELGMLSEEPFKDPWTALWHYREFVRLSPEHADRPVVDRWVGRIERSLLVELAERHPGTVVSADLRQLRAERDVLLSRLRRAGVLNTTLREKYEALDESQKQAARERLATLRKQVRNDIAAASAGGEPLSEAPPTVAPEAKRPVEPVRAHTIVAGDTLAAISRQYYGSIRYWPKLQVYNRDLLRGGTVLVLGNRIRIPPLTELKRTRTPRAGEPKK